MLTPGKFHRNTMPDSLPYNTIYIGLRSGINLALPGFRFLWSTEAS
ncbi:MAG: hypothetical protein ACPG7F_13885 [Aggregatilineales bacterium]